MFRKLLTTCLMLFVINLAFLSNSNTSVAQVKGEVPGKSLGLKSDADLWRYVRTVSYTHLTLPTIVDV